MDKKIIEDIFNLHNLDGVKSIKKIEIGFTNKIYLINNKYILKICTKVTNEPNFEKEVYFYTFFKDKINIPNIKIFDKSKTIYNKYFMIYDKIEGDNLYSKWHLLTNNERKDIIKQLCDILKIINNTPFDEFKQKFKIIDDNWDTIIFNKINKSLGKIESKTILSQDFITNINKFVNDNKSVLKQQKMALVYWDVHFDNILIKDNRIVGLLDFERTEIASIDFVLDIVKRMQEYPKKYMSEGFEKYAKKEDYNYLLNWFKEFYPELFDFKDLNIRLALYDLENTLQGLVCYPNSKEVKDMLEKIIN